MRREDRKKQKKRLRERKKAADQRLHSAALQRAALYPQVVLDPLGGDPGFISTLQKLISDFDFDNPDICTPGQRKVYQTIRRVGSTAMLKRMDGAIRHGVQKGFTRADMEEAILGPMFMHLGEWLFERLPDECRSAPLPFHYFCVHPRNHHLGISFSFLPSVTSPHGRIYFSHLEPTVSFGGGLWKVGFFRHAIERICERLCPSPTISYAHFNVCAMYFRDCVYFEPLELPDGQHAIRLLEYCERHDDGLYHPYVDGVLEGVRPCREEGQAYFVLGYCPVVFCGRRAVAKTFLYPGYRNTPEDHLVRVSRMSEAERRSDLPP